MFPGFLILGAILFIMDLRLNRRLFALVYLQMLALLILAAALVYSLILYARMNTLVLISLANIFVMLKVKAEIIDLPHLIKDSALCCNQIILII